MRQIICTLLVLLLCGCEGLFNDVSDVEYISRAQVLLDDGKLKSASIELKNALADNPDNAQARWLLGKLYVEVGNGSAAEKELHRASELGVNDDSVIPLLLKALLLQKDYKGVLEQDLGSITGDKFVAEFMASRGLAYIAQKKIEEARRELDAALLRGSDLPYVLTTKAFLSAVGGDQAEARSYLKKALAQNNAYAPAWSLIGDLTPIKDEAEKAIEAYTKAINNRLGNMRDLLKRTFLFIQLERYEEAQSDLNQLKTRFPNNASVDYAQGVLYFLQKRLPEAQSSLERVLNSNNNEMRATFYLGATQLLQGNYEQAKDYLSRFVVAEPRYIPGRLLLAQISLMDGEFAEVEDLVRPVLKSKPEEVLPLNILASALIKQGKTDEGIELLEKVVKLQPEVASARMQLGIGLLAKGEKERGFESLESAIEIDPQLQQVDIILVLNYLRGNEVKKALKTAKSFVSRQPENVAAYNMLGMAFLADKQEKEAEHAFLAARKLVPGDPGASQQLAELALKTKEPEKARTYLKEVLERYPDHLRTFLHLADIEARQGKTEAREAILMDAMMAHPNAVQPRLLLAHAYLRERKTDRARVVLGDILEKNRGNPDVLDVFGELQLIAKDFTSAKSIFQESLLLRPKSVQAHFLLAKAYSGLDDLKGAQLELEKVLELSPAHLPAKIALTRLLLTKKDIGSAKKQLVLLKEIASENSEVLALEGDILAKLGDSEQALIAYRKRFDVEPSTATIIALVGHQWAMGDRDGSVFELERWSRGHPEDIRAKLALANNYLGMERQDDAMHLYRQVLKLSENNLLALNNLAWHFRKSNPELALSYAERASVLEPESVMIMDTLALVLLQKGELVRSQRVIERALERRPGNPTLLFRHAVYLEKSGQEKKAMDALKMLLKKRVQFPERTEAEQLLKQLSGS